MLRPLEGLRNQSTPLFYAQRDSLNILEVRHGIATQRQEAGFEPFLQVTDPSCGEDCRRRGFHPNLQHGQVVQYPKFPNIRRLLNRAVVRIVSSYRQPNSGVVHQSEVGLLPLPEPRPGGIRNVGG